MASLENLDEEALRAKLEEATSYEERAAIRQALRSLKKERGEQVGGSKGARRGASCYNRFAGGSRSGSASKTPQSFVPAGHKSPSVTPLRSTTPTSRSQRVSTPTSPSSVSSPGPSAEEEEMRRQKQREIEEQKRRREEEKKEREQEEERKRQREEEKRAMDEERRLQREQEEQELEHQREEEERQLQREQEEQERERLGEEEEQQLQKEQEEEEKEHEREELQEREGQADNEDNEEGPKSPPSTPVEKEREEEWVVVDKSRAQQLEKEASALLDQDQTDGQEQSFGVQLRSTHAAKGTPSHEAPEPKAEFQKFQLRKTQSNAGEKSNSEPISSSMSNFGVRLKPTTSASSQRARAQTYVTSVGHKSASASGRRGAPPTTANLQRSSSKTQANVPREFSTQSGLVAYVNMALQLHPPLSPSSSALYETCSNPSLLCKLINKSVPNTVDLRALTRTPPPSQAASREEALQENMTLVVESARAIGCRIDDDSGQRILNKDPETIRIFLLDLIRARVVHMPGMDDEPASTFENVTLMLEKLGISSGGSEDTDQPQASYVPKERASPCSSAGSVQGKATTIDPSPAKQTSVASTGPDKPSLDADLTYEERAARRRAERERRRREREALATAK